MLTRDIEQRIEMRTVDEPESPDVSPDGRRVAFAALQNGVGDIFVVDLVTQEITNVTKDEFADSAPTWSPDGRSLVYLARVSGNEKLFRLDIDSGRKTQLTFGTHDDGTAQFLDADTLVFSSTATDPSQPIDPEVARNGNIYNVWTLSLKNGELRQYTDAVGGNLYATVLRQGAGAPRIAFIDLLQGPSTSCTRSTAATRSSRRRQRTSARRAARSSTSRRRSRTRWSPRTRRRRARSRRCSWTAARR